MTLSSPSSTFGDEDRASSVGRSSGAYARGPRVLIVDDFLDSREMYAEYLSALGFHCNVAADGDEGFEKAVAELPDVVVMDTATPGLDGTAAVARLRSDARTRAIAIVVVTGQDTHVDSAESGVDAYVTKPCLPRALAQTLVSVVERRG